MTRRNRLLGAALVLALCLLLAGPAPAPARAAAIWYVASDGDDSQDCRSPARACATIEGALHKPDLAPLDTIRVASGLYRHAGAQVALIDRSAHLSGGWNADYTAQGGTATLDGERARVGVFVPMGATVTLERFTVENATMGINNQGTLTVTHSTIGGALGNSMNGIENGWGTLYLIASTVSNNSGGGIRNTGALTLVGSTVSGNRTGLEFGGGIYNLGTITMTNCTISGNVAERKGGGGISNYYDGAVALYNCTVAANQASVFEAGYTGGGIHNLGRLTLSNTIVATNGLGNPDADGQDCNGFTSGGHNLIGNGAGCGFDAAPGDLVGAPALLYPTLWGAPGVHPTLPGSAAIDGGDPAGCRDGAGAVLADDQRGAPRAGRCDIGAYEYNLAYGAFRHSFAPLVTGGGRRPELERSRPGGGPW